MRVRLKKKGFGCGLKLFSGAGTGAIMVREITKDVGSGAGTVKVNPAKVIQYFLPSK